MSRRPAAPWGNRIIRHGSARAVDLLANPENWRVHTHAQEQALAGVLHAVGYVQSVVVNLRTAPEWGRDRGVETLIDGHLRVQNAISRGDDVEVPVTYVDLTPEEERTVLATFDRITEMAGRDEDKLVALIAELPEDLQAVTALVGASLAADTPPETPEGGGRVVPPSGEELDVAPPVRPETDIVAGDVFQLGRHRLVCGDARDPLAIAAATQGEKVRLVLTDPPYCSGGFQEAGRAAGTWGSIASDALSTRGYSALMKDALAAARTQVAYLFTDWRMWIPLYDLAESSGLAVRSMIVWDKGTPGLGALWRTQHELVMFASRERNARIKGLPAIGNVIRTNRTGNEHHYTEKPVDLLTAILKNDQSSERLDCPVLDMFAGSGSTLIACETLDRTCWAVEVEPLFCQVIIDRWQNLTGKKAVKLQRQKLGRPRRGAQRATEATESDADRSASDERDDDDA